MPVIGFGRPQYARSIWQLVRCAHQSSGGGSGNNYKVNTLKKNAVYIAAAVRTPTAPFNELQEAQLADAVVDELVKRATVPREEFKKLIMCTSCAEVGNDALSGVANNLGLRQCESHAFQNEACSVTGLHLTLQSLQDGENDVIILGDIRRGGEEAKLGCCQSELMAVQQPKQRPLKRLLKQALGESSSNANPAEMLGAAAVALTTEKAAARLKLQPLARVRDVIVEPNSQDTLFWLPLRQQIQLSDVRVWELVTRKQEMGLQLNLLADLNINKVCTHDVTQTTASHLLTHLAHGLPAGGLGCALIEAAENRYMLVMLEKLPVAAAKGLPQLTLYTKDPCPLCDELVGQLEQSFAGEYELQKIYIDQKENVRYLRLYRNDIPVLFLNGQFLCMHKLNESALRERLVALKRRQSS